MVTKYRLKQAEQIYINNNKSSLKNRDFVAHHPHLHKYRFKYENGKVAREMFDVGDFIFSYDLK